jgi:MoxR-like ATPase
MTDALRRRCLYLHLDYPEPARELLILSQHVPEAERALCTQIVQFVQRARTLDLRKAPSIAETVDWARTLVLLSADSLETPSCATASARWPSSARTWKSWRRCWRRRSPRLARQSPSNAESSVASSLPGPSQLGFS